MALQILKKLKDNTAKKGIKYHLHKGLGGVETERSMDTVHASSVTKNSPTDEFCPRSYALHDLLKPDLEKVYTSAATRATYDYGHEVQDLAIRWMSRAGIAITHWKCASCSTMHRWCKEPAKCAKCGCRVLKPVEPRFESQLSGVSCGIDCLVKLESPKLQITEIKSMGKDEFSTLKAPLPEHRKRTNLYLRLVQESSDPIRDKIDPKAARIFYVCKGGYQYDADLLDYSDLDPREKYSLFKEYVVERDDKATDDLAQLGQAVLLWRQGVGVMPCGVCSNVGSKRAQSCRFRSPCFSGDFPTGMANPKPWSETVEA